MRTQIAKALQKRSKTIRKAVNAYNTAAVALDPPKPTVDWSKVSHFNFLEEFTLLRNTHRDITDKRWTEPAVRETMKLWNRLCRAREEIIRCNVEIRRLHTSIVDEHAIFSTLVSEMPPGPVKGAVLDYITRRRQTNEYILTKIYKLQSMQDFSGEQNPGTRKGIVSKLDTLCVKLNSSRT
jgi:hypothetical protein